MALKVVKLTRSLTVGGTTVTETVNDTVEKEISFKKSLTAAKTGSLTTRTDNDTGTLTMAASHGIQTGDKVDIYWTGGSRYNVTVGTVSGNSVPIDVGSGDNLPVLSTAVKVQVVTTVDDIAITGDNVKALLISCANEGRATFFNGSSIVYSQHINAGVVFCWHTTANGTNPLAGVSVTKVVISQAGTTTKEFVVAVGV